MPHPCVVCGRSRMNPNNREEDYVFFGFPVNDDARCQKWLTFCCREDLYKLTKKQLLQRMVCSKHFKLTDFVNEYLDRLNCSAVPSIYDPKQSLYNITCVLCGRSRKEPPDYDGVTFHHFPGEEFRCLEWLDFVGVSSYYRLTRKEILFCYICSKHFDASQFIEGYTNRLVDYSVPNIRYPDSSNEMESIVEMNLAKMAESVPMDKVYPPLVAEVLESQACAACHRLRSDPNNKQEKYKFHPFPAYEIGRCLKWCKFLGREDLLKMSPNQIRKLVLCSKHFESGQSFHKVGPCDAVPTIMFPDTSKGDPLSIDPDEELYQDDPSKNPKKCIRPLVSSKKPKIDNKPAPLAKKRGKSRRPTSINIPKPDFDKVPNDLRKLPLPPSNWKIQQFQPITLASNIANNVQSDINKVILPFSADISNLGAPIPVNSLSSIPPGLLIKIDLPNSNKKPLKPLMVKNVKERVPTTIDNFDLMNADIVISDQPNHLFLPDIETFPNQDELLAQDIELQHGTELQMKVEDEDHFKVEVEETSCYQARPPKSLHKRRRRIPSRTRRTILPIACEVRTFLQKIKVHMRRLPKNAKARLKLSIVNQVIDRL